MVNDGDLLRSAVNQRAAGVVETVVRDHPYLIGPYLEKMVSTCRDFKEDGVKRNFLKIFIDIDFNDDLLGRVMNLCFDFINDKKNESIAVRVYSMQILYNISQKIPEIKQELILIIENEMLIGSAAWRARGSQLLRKLYKEV